MAACDALTVKLCSFSAPIAACDLTDPLNPKPILFVGVIDGAGNLIPTSSTMFASAGTGFSGDGAGFIRSYFTDATGTPLATAPTAYSFSGECAAAAPQTDLEIGCLVDSADPQGAPIPVRVTMVVNADGTITQSFSDLLSGVAIVPSATQSFDNNCDRYDIESSPMCVRDATTGAILRQVNVVTVYDTATAIGAAPVLYNASTGVIDALAATEVLGSCDVYPPLVFTGCISDGDIRTSVRQVVPVVNGMPTFTAASYIDPQTGAPITLAATGSFADGPCLMPCRTCPPTTVVPPCVPVAADITLNPTTVSNLTPAAGEIVTVSTEVCNAAACPATFGFDNVGNSGSLAIAQYWDYVPGSISVGGVAAPGASGELLSWPAVTIPANGCVTLSYQAVVEAGAPAGNTQFQIRMQDNSLPPFMRPVSAVATVARPAPVVVPLTIVADEPTGGYAAGQALNFTVTACNNTATAYGSIAVRVPVTPALSIGGPDLYALNGPVADNTPTPGDLVPFLPFGASTYMAILDLAGLAPGACVSYVIPGYAMDVPGGSQAEATTFDYTGQLLYPSGFTASYAYDSAAVAIDTATVFFTVNA